MPARTAKGTAMLRRVRGFRTVIDKAETHLSQWAEKENVFTRYLPYAVVFGLTEMGEGVRGPGRRAARHDVVLRGSAALFVLADFGDAIDGFAVTTGGTLASTRIESGSSGFGGGGSPAEAVEGAAAVPGDVRSLTWLRRP